MEEEKGVAVRDMNCLLPQSYDRYKPQQYTGSHVSKCR